jgi:enamine deaminase RidA (YjgF/YER057c/UK114 family)
VFEIKANKIYSGPYFQCEKVGGSLSHTNHVLPSIKVRVLPSFQKVITTLEEFLLSMTMLMTMNLVVKDHNDYNYFSYYGRVVMDI